MRRVVGQRLGLLCGKSEAAPNGPGAGEVDDDLQLRHLNVKVYGNVAVVTGYVVGTETSPDGTTEEVANRRTAVLVKQGGQWKEAHIHISPLVAPE